MRKEVIDLRSRYPIIAARLVGSANLFPFVDPSPNDRIHWFLKGSGGLVVGHREKADSLFGKL